MKKLLLPFFILGTVVMIIVMATTGKPLKTPATPSGIVQLEFAYNTKKVNQVFQSWGMGSDHSQIETARINTYWDFLFIFFYAGLLFLSCSRLSGIYRDGTGFNKAGKLLAKTCLAAGGLDIIENGCMLQSLGGNSSNFFALTAAICAGLKFTFLLLAVMYILISLPLSVYALFRKRQP